MAVWQKTKELATEVYNALPSWKGALLAAALVGAGAGGLKAVQWYRAQSGVEETTTEADGTVVRTFRMSPRDAKAEKKRVYTLISPEGIDTSVEVAPDAVRAANAAYIMSVLEQRADGQYVPRSQDLGPADVYMRFSSMKVPTETSPEKLTDKVTREGAEHARKLAGERLGVHDFGK